MKTYRLWLEPDPTFPRFKRLAFDQVEVPIADVLVKGIHPWQKAESSLTLRSRFLGGRAAYNLTHATL